MRLEPGYHMLDWMNPCEKALGPTENLVKVVASVSRPQSRCIGTATPFQQVAAGHYTRLLCPPILAIARCPRINKQRGHRARRGSQPGADQKVSTKRWAELC